MKNGTELSTNPLSLLKKLCTDYVRLTVKTSKKLRLIANPGCYPTCSTLIYLPIGKGRNDRSEHDYY